MTQLQLTPVLLYFKLIWPVRLRGCILACHSILVLLLPEYLPGATSVADPYSTAVVTSTGRHPGQCPIHANDGGWGSRRTLACHMRLLALTRRQSPTALAPGTKQRLVLRQRKHVRRFTPMKRKCVVIWLN